MKCQEVQQWLLLSRAFAEGHEKPAPVELSQHLVNCVDCKNLQQQEVWYDQAIHEAMHKVTIPVDLERQVLWRLRQARRQQQRARVLYGTLAAAAAFIIAICLGWYIQRPYDLARLHEAIQGIESRQTSSTYIPGQGKQPGDLQLWLKRQGVASSLPARLKLQHLTAAYLVEIGGRKVAVLEMRAGSSTSMVCLLQRRLFNEQLQQQMRDQAILSSVVISDHEHSESLGWMIVDQGSAHLFVDGMVPQNGA